MAHIGDDADPMDAFYGMDDAFEEFEVRAGEATVHISLACMPRQRLPVQMEVGPVVHLDDLLGSKFCALAGRSEPRDFIDVAAALDRGFRRDRILELAHEHEPILAEDEIAAAMRRLDGLPDARFARYGLDQAAIARMRAAFADWPRD